MKDWFYAPGNEIVSAESGLVKSAAVKAIKMGYKSVHSLEHHLKLKFAPNEIEDVDYLIRIYGPMSYDNQSGCSGCDGCVAKSH